MEDDDQKNALAISRRDVLKTGGIVLAGIAAGLPVANSVELDAQTDNLISYVDPMIGTDAHGHTFPGASAPFGMVQLSPDSGMNGWDWCSGYNYSDKKIAGFSHTHLSGTGIGDLCDILFMPILSDGKPPGDIRSDFTHGQEKAHPGYYSVQLHKYDIKVELTASPRVGVHRYTFQVLRVGTHPAVVIDLGSAINWDTPTDTYIRIEKPTVVSGFRRSTGWAKDQHVYFVAHFSEQIQSHTFYETGAQSSNEPEMRGKRTKAVLDFNLPTNTVLEIQVGISPVSVEGARHNLRSETGGWDFGYLKREAYDAWQKELSKVKVVTSNTGLKKTFYTSLYHSMLAPTLFCDVNRSYRGSG